MRRGVISFLPLVKYCKKSLQVYQNDSGGRGMCGQCKPEWWCWSLSPAKTESRSLSPLAMAKSLTEAACKYNRQVLIRQSWWTSNWKVSAISIIAISLSRGIVGIQCFSISITMRALWANFQQSDTQVGSIHLAYWGYCRRKNGTLDLTCNWVCVYINRNLN